MSKETRATRLVSPSDKEVDGWVAQRHGAGPDFVTELKH